MDGIAVQLVVNQALAVPKLMPSTKRISKNARGEAFRDVISFRAKVIGPYDEIAVIKKADFVLHH